MSLNIGEVVSVQVGRVRTIVAPTAAGKEASSWTSGIFKSAVNGPVMVRTLGIEGDAQADQRVHGGPDGAVMAYSVDHYPTWESDFGKPIPFGTFGENLTVRGFDDQTVCLGDVWEIGPAGGVTLEVTQPRQPCFKLAHRVGDPRVVKWVTQRCNGGWYFRVLNEGPVAAGMEIRQVKRGLTEWPVAEAVRVMYARSTDVDAARRLGQAAPLSSRWKEDLASL